MDNQALKLEYDGLQVRVYLINGTSLSGKARFLNDEWLAIENDDGKKALCNLNHIVSICRT
jgi:sRNA-binding regulator protein Hfq